MEYDSFDVADFEPDDVGSWEATAYDTDASAPGGNGGVTHVTPGLAGVIAGPAAARTAATAASTDPTVHVAAAAANAGIGDYIRTKAEKAERLKERKADRARKERLLGPLYTQNHQQRPVAAATGTPNDRTKSRRRLHQSSNSGQGPRVGESQRSDDAQQQNHSLGSHSPSRHNNTTNHDDAGQSPSARAAPGESESQRRLRTQQQRMDSLYGGDGANASPRQSAASPRQRTRSLSASGTRPRRATSASGQRGGGPPDSAVVAGSSSVPAPPPNLHSSRVTNGGSGMGVGATGGGGSSGAPKAAMSTHQDVDRARRAFPAQFASVPLTKGYQGPHTPRKTRRSELSELDQRALPGGWDHSRTRGSAPPQPQTRTRTQSSDRRAGGQPYSGPGQSQRHSHAAQPPPIGSVHDVDDDTPRPAVAAASTATRAAAAVAAGTSYRATSSGVSAGANVVGDQHNGQQHGAQHSGTGVGVGRGGGGGGPHGKVHPLAARPSARSSSMGPSGLGTAGAGGSKPTRSRSVPYLPPLQSRAVAPDGTVSTAPSPTKNATANGPDSTPVKTPRGATNVGASHDDTHGGNSAREGRGHGGGSRGGAGDDRRLESADQLTPRRTAWGAADNGHSPMSRERSTPRERSRERPPPGSLGPGGPRGAWQSSPTRRSTTQRLDHTPLLAPAPRRKFPMKSAGPGGPGGSLKPLTPRDHRDRSDATPQATPHQSSAKHHVPTPESGRRYTDDPEQETADAITAMEEQIAALTKTVADERAARHKLSQQLVSKKELLEGKETQLKRIKEDVTKGAAMNRKVQEMERKHNDALKDLRKADAELRELRSMSVAARNRLTSLGMAIPELPQGSSMDHHLNGDEHESRGQPSLTDPSASASITAKEPVRATTNQHNQQGIDEHGNGDVDAGASDPQAEARAAAKSHEAMAATVKELTVERDALLVKIGKAMRAKNLATKAAADSFDPHDTAVLDSSCHAEHSTPKRDHDVTPSAHPTAPAHSSTRRSASDTRDTRDSATTGRRPPLGPLPPIGRRRAASSTAPSRGRSMVSHAPVGAAQRSVGNGGSNGVGLSGGGSGLPRPPLPQSRSRSGDFSRRGDFSGRGGGRTMTIQSTATTPGTAEGSRSSALRPRVPLTAPQNASRGAPRSRSGGPRGIERPAPPPLLPPRRAMSRSLSADRAASGPTSGQVSARTNTTTGTVDVRCTVGGRSAMSRETSAGSSSTVRQYHTIDIAAEVAEMKTVVTKAMSPAVANAVAAVEATAREDLEKELRQMKEQHRLAVRQRHREKLAKAGLPLDTPLPLAMSTARRNSNDDDNTGGGGGGANTSFTGGNTFVTSAVPPVFADALAGHHPTPERKSLSNGHNGTADSTLGPFADLPNDERMAHQQEVNSLRTVLQSLKATTAAVVKQIDDKKREHEQIAVETEKLAARKKKQDDDAAAEHTRALQAAEDRRKRYEDDAKRFEAERLSITTEIEAINDTIEKTKSELVAAERQRKVAAAAAAKAEAAKQKADRENERIEKECRELESKIAAASAQKEKNEHACFDQREVVLELKKRLTKGKRELETVREAMRANDALDAEIETATRQLSVAEQRERDAMREQRSLLEKLDHAERLASMSL